MNRELKTTIYLVPEDEEVCHKLNSIGLYPTPYDNFVNLCWIEEMKFCGCGAGFDCRKYIASILRSMEERSQSGWEIDKVNEVISNPEMQKYFVLYVLDAMELTEHGSSVNGSWLTDKGRALMKEFEQEEEE